MVKKNEPKKLIVSMKSSSQAMSDFKKAFEDVRKGRLEGTHYEISFDSKKGFDQFVKNISVLSFIASLKPQSIGELAKIAKMRVSKLNEIIIFFEEAGVIRLMHKKIAGCKIARPILKFDKIEFNLDSNN